MILGLCMGDILGAGVSILSVNPNFDSSVEVSYKDNAFQQGSSLCCTLLSQA